MLNDDHGKQIQLSWPRCASRREIPEIADHDSTAFDRSTWPDILSTPVEGVCGPGQLFTKQSSIHVNIQAHVHSIRTTTRYHTCCGCIKYYDL